MIAPPEQNHLIDIGATNRLLLRSMKTAAYFKNNWLLLSQRLNLFVVTSCNNIAFAPEEQPKGLPAFNKQDMPLLILLYFPKTENQLL